jgi:hypothetical protein
MRRFGVFIGVLVAAALVAAGAASSKSGPKNLGCGAGKLVIDIRFTVVQDVDTGVRGNNWAFDNYTRAVKVWRKSPGRFCAASTYGGTFTTIEGTSPGGTGFVPAGIAGTMTGFYRTNVFRGTLLATPKERKAGNLGTFSFACTAASKKGSCPGSFDWPSAYFAGGANYTIVQYKFTYRTKRNGTWQLIGLRSHGDIVGKKKPPPVRPR